MKLPRISDQHTTETAQSRLQLRKLQEQIDQWKYTPDNMSELTGLLGVLQFTESRLQSHTWYSSDISMMKRCLSDIALTLLNNPCTSAYARIPAPAVTKMLSQYDWWHDYLSSPQQQYALAFALLQSVVPGTPRHVAACADDIGRQWAHECTAEARAERRGAVAKLAEQVKQWIMGQPAPPQTQEQLATRLFGAAWVALYGDSLAAPEQLASHLRETPPLFAWDITPCKEDGQPQSLPADLSL